MKLTIATLVFTATAFGQAPATTAPAKPQVAPAQPAASAPPPRLPIRAEYQTMYQGILAAFQNAQKAAQAAVDKLTEEVCADEKIPVKNCEVNFGAGSFGEKTPTAPVPTPPKK
jgi:hypothetical protein